MSIKGWIRSIVRELIEAALDAKLPSMLKKLEELEEKVEAFTELAREIAIERERFAMLTDVIDQRIEKGNAIWRQIRARESRAEQLAEEGEWDDGVQGGDAPGGNPGQLSLLPQGMESHANRSESWETKKRALDRQIAGLE